jgi:hypothetical protein
MTAAVVTAALTSCAGPAGLEGVVDDVLDAGPGRDSPAYHAPAPVAAHQLGGAVLALLSGADDPALPEGTRTVDAVDAGGRPVRVVAEEIDGGTARGWGAYAVRAGAGTPPGLVVEVPHPRADRWTEDIGAELFASLDADALLVAGAHRTAGGDAADVAHEPASAFAAVDRAVVGPGTVVVQVHGFDESRHEGSAEVVLSSAESTSGPLVADLAEALEDDGVDTCVYDGERCRALAGTTNVQAAHARGVGATFVHLELARELRRSGPARDQVLATLARVLTG